VITRLEGGILVGLYGLYLVEQVLTNTVTSAVDEFRLVALVVVVPLVLVFLVWQTLRWRQQRHA
jgi:cation:H+ antiporter